MAEIHFTARPADTWRFFDLHKAEENSTYCVALTGTDGKVIPGSQISENFTSLGAAFSAHADLLPQYPDAAVFDVKGLEACNA